jgi:hypothetical protein
MVFTVFDYFNGHNQTGPKTGGTKSGRIVVLERLMFDKSWSKLLLLLTLSISAISFIYLKSTYVGATQMSAI